MRNKMSYLALIIFFVLGNVFDSFSQNKEHSCYGKALMPDEYEIVQELVQVKPASTRIEKIPYNKELRITKIPIPNTNPVEYEYRRDSIVPYPINTRTIEIPAEYIIISKKKLKKKGGYYEEVEVICEHDLTKEKLNLIRQPLVLLGYTIDNFSALKYALEDYQKNNGLPIGQIDFKTLKHLGL